MLGRHDCASTIAKSFFVCEFVHMRYSCNDTIFRCIDILSPLYHDTVIYYMIQVEYNKYKDFIFLSRMLIII